MKIAIAQLNCTVGDLRGNVARIAEFAERARAQGAALMRTPELSLCGYRPEDQLVTMISTASATLQCWNSQPTHLRKSAGARPWHIVDGNVEQKRLNCAHYRQQERDGYRLCIYRLTNYRNGISKVIPGRVIPRAPSAELRPDQTDQDRLPPYAVLDAIMEAYVEHNLRPREIEAMGYSRKDTERVIGLLPISEYSGARLRSGSA